LPFYIWLAGFRRKTPGDCLCGAVVSALIINMTVNFFLLQQLAADEARWINASLVRSLLVVPSVFLSAFAVGLWTSIVADDKFAHMYRLYIAFMAIFVGESLWFTAPRLQELGIPAFVWLSCFAISAAMRAGLVAYGIRCLLRQGIYFRIRRAAR